MSDALSPDAIEELFARADRGAVPMAAEQDASRGHDANRRTRWLRTVDFSRPTKFTTDQERRLRRLLDAFCAQAAQRLMAEHRLPLELEVIDVQQLTFVDAFKLLPEASVHATLTSAPHDARLLLSSEVQLMCTAIEALLGGDPTVPVPDRPLTEIDRRIVRRLMSSLTAVLSGLWFEQAETTLDLLEVHASDESVQITANSEATLALTLEARLHRSTATVALLVPFSVIAPIAGAFARREEAVVSDDPAAGAAVRDGLSRVELTLRAEVASTEISLDDLLSLAPGDVLKLDGSATDPVRVLADRTPVYTAVAGRSGGRRAVQVLGAMEDRP